MIGTPSTGETTGRVAALLKSGGRSRALTMVRTELGRAYSLAPATPRDPPPRPSIAAASRSPGCNPGKSSTPGNAAAAGAGPDGPELEFDEDAQARLRVVVVFSGREVYLGGGRRP